MQLSREEVLHIARLARLGINSEDVPRFQEQLSNILENFVILNRVDTTTVPPTSQSLSLKNVTRKDEVKPDFPLEDILANAPQREGDFFRVRPVLE